jgi:putative FmdB family regulatory protein
MPTYDYRCTECDQTATVSVKITENPSVPVCVACGVTMVRVFGLGAVTFKGTGWGKD